MQRGFPLGAAVTLAELERDPHELLARLREREPVSWVPALGGWLVTSYELALSVIRDADTFTVDDPRFSTAQVVGPSMLSLDGGLHARHREPFAGPFRPLAVRECFAEAVAAEADRLLEELEPGGSAELRRAFAGPLAAGAIAHALGLERDEVATVLRWYAAIAGAVTEITAGAPVPEAGQGAFAELRARLEQVIGDRSSMLGAAAADSELTHEEIASNAAVLLFGGIETTEGMIANAVLALLEHPEQLARAARDAGALERAIEEAARLEPAAAIVDRYATRDIELGGARVGAGELVHVSITAAGSDPTVFDDPERFDPDRPEVRRHLAFAHGPHVCLGVHLARLEARVGVGAVLRQLPNLRLDPERPSAVRGLVFRKPPELNVLWG